MKGIDVLNRAVIVLTGVFLSTFLSWFSAYWLPETRTVVLSVLIIICLTEMVPYLNSWLRRLFQLLIVVFWMFHLFGWELIPPESISWGLVLESVWNHFLRLEVLYPFIWFAIGTWVIYIFFIRWFESKMRTLLTVLPCTIIMAVLDTFTYHELVSNIILMICSVLLLLVVHHFRSLKNKSPDGWDHLKDYPETVYVPILLFFLIVLVASIFTPDRMGPLLTDPYTAWKNYRGEETAISPYTDSELDLGSSRSEERLSGYGRDDRELGGSFNFDYSPVMTVETTDATYLRGETRYYYTGLGWESSDTSYHLNNAFYFSEEHIEMGERKGNSLENRSLLQTKEVTQTITFSNELYSGTALFGAYSIDNLEIEEVAEREEVLDVNQPVVEGMEDISTSVGEGAHSSFLWLPYVEELHFLEMESLFPRKYTIVSQVPMIDEGALRKVDHVEDKQDWSMYLQLPGDLPERVSDLALEITTDKENQYDQVKAIETFLKESFPYTTEPDESLGTSGDFVDRFLFEVQEGYCDYFSTAMVVLTRTLDIPSRWVKGYTQGTRNEEHNYFQEHMAPFGAGVYQVRNANAHSWVEVYFDGYGWLPFEPTASFSAPSIYVQEDMEVSVQMEERESNQGDDRFFAGGYKVVISILTMVVITVCILLFIVSIWRKKGLKHFLKWWNSGRDLTNNDKVIMEVERLLRFAHRKGFKSFHGDTFKETADRWVYQDIHLETELRIIQTLFDKGRYGNASITDQELQQVLEAIRKVRDKFNKK
ncbi:transglutaminase TgpA family protein [Evansella tamaricis]|uniref:DUF3488 and transglutaminase-like domain-containing protein n=1 Tax=Evansella tamaricis TaxID=2069301 RepID=A0ABS6JFF2_9BACI|nr:transglutaminase domain-containing protein [Evansella tamaricis]MBU9712346.1 DUF3488 and transglutaminase-like domain-containing protein [Evansella tamaricis]